jgi:hypothetical protein
LDFARSNQTRFQATPPQNLPLQHRHIGYQHLFDNIGRLYRCEHTGEKLIIGGGILPLDEQGRAKQSQSRDGLGGAILYLYTFHETSRIFGSPRAALPAGSGHIVEIGGPRKTNRRQIFTGRGFSVLEVDLKAGAPERGR